MTGEKHRSRYRKKRKGKGFSGVRKQDKYKPEVPSNDCENSGVARVIQDIQAETPGRGQQFNDDSDDCEQPVSASRKKMRICNSTAENLDTNTVEYRLMNLENLTPVFSSIHKCEGQYKK